jgi:hypothetical protein
MTNDRINNKWDGEKWVPKDTYPTTLSDKGLARFFDWVKDNCADHLKRQDGKYLTSPLMWLQEIESAVADNHSCRKYKMAESNSASGRAVVFTFTDDDLVFLTID